MDKLKLEVLEHRLTTLLKEEMVSEFKHKGWGLLLRAIYHLRHENDAPHWFLDLTPREQKLLAMRFGLFTGTTTTMEKTGKEFGITPERVRQIQEKALERIRSRINVII
jgi:DNA-directed RNA polymerase sigma subunit (sigma70/sigma32)